MNIIPGASWLGLGFNILGSNNLSSANSSILTPVSGTGGTPYTDPNTGTIYAVPNNVAVSTGAGDQTQDAQVFAAKSQQDFQSYLAAQAGVSGSYRGFSGAFNAAFSKEAQSETMYWYCLASGNFEGWIVFLQESSQQQFSTEFSADPDIVALQKLSPPVFKGNEALFYRIFQRWGTHFVDKVTVGGNINYYAAVNTAFSSDQNTIATDLSLEYRSLLVDVAAKASVDWQTLGQQWSSDRTVSWTATGGDNSLLEGIDPSPSFGENFNGAFQNWAGSIMDNPAVIGFHLRDLSELFAGELAEAVTDALTAYTEKGVYAQAEFTSSNSILTSYAGMILLNGETVPNPAPAPNSGDQIDGVAQLTVFDGTTLETLVNMGAYFDYTTSPMPWVTFWDSFYQAVQGLTGQSYIVALTGSGLNLADSFPSSDFASWLAGCGGALTQWREQMGVPFSDDYNVSYVLIGQQGLQPGQAIEKFTSNLLAPRTPPESGDFFANATTPLIPAIGSGPYTLPVSNLMALKKQA